MIIELLPNRLAPPGHFTPLRASAHIFADAAGYRGFEVKVKESKESPHCAWDVFVREPSAARGKKIGAMIGPACQAFCCYSYNL